MTNEPNFLPSGFDGARQLARHLRQPMPKGFEWDFTTIFPSDHDDRCGCAIGLIAELYPEQFHGNKFKLVDDICDHFCMDDDTLRSIFFSSDDYNVDSEYVTPEMVADAIDEWLEENNQPTSMSEGE